MMSQITMWKLLDDDVFADFCRYPSTLCRLSCLSLIMCEMCSCGVV